MDKLIDGVLSGNVLALVLLLSLTLERVAKYWAQHNGRGIRPQLDRIESALSKHVEEDKEFQEQTIDDIHRIDISIARLQEHVLPPIN